MIHKIHLYIALLLVFVLFSCSKKSSADIMMERAESALSVNPDSALAIIGSIPINEVISARQKAEFILLYERILEKKEINLIGEADMEDAVAYFDKYGTNQQRFLSHFYLGRLYDMSDNQYGAMEQYVQAEAIAKELSGYDDILARLYLYKGDIYQNKLNSNGALKMYLKSAEHYSEIGDNISLMNTLGKVAAGYEGIGKYEKALEAYNLALNAAYKNGTDKDVLKYATSIAGMGFSTGVPSSLILKQLDSIYTIYNNGVAPVGNYIMLSCLYLDNGNIKKAKEYADLYEKKSESLSAMEQAGLASLRSSIAKSEGNFKAALYYKEAYDGAMEQINEQERANSVQEIEQLYYNKQLKIENESIKRRSRDLGVIYLLLVIILLLGLVWVVVTWRRKIKEKNGLIEEYLLAANEAELSKNNLLGELDMQKEKEKRLKELLENRFAEIRELAGTYYEFGYSKKLQKKVEQLLSLQSFGKDMFEVIENVVNAKNNGAMEKIRENYPSITEENFKLLNLIYAGFSPQEISVILNDTPQNIYVRKSRLKRKISALLEKEPDLSFK